MYNVRSTHDRNNEQHSYAGLQHHVHSFQHSSQQKSHIKWIAVSASLECRKCYLISTRNAHVRLAMNRLEIGTACRVRCIIYQFQPAQGAHCRTIVRVHALTCIVRVCVCRYVGVSWWLFSDERKISIRDAFVLGWVAVLSVRANVMDDRQARGPLFHHLRECRNEIKLFYLILRISYESLSEWWNYIHWVANNNVPRVLITNHTILKDSKTQLRDCVEHI